MYNNAKFHKIINIKTLAELLVVRKMNLLCPLTGKNLFT